MLVRSVGVPVGLRAVMVCLGRVLLSSIVSAMLVMMRCLPVVMGGGLVVARCRVMMFGSRMSCCRGHSFPPFCLGRRCAAVAGMC
jgi:hypothetical protein